MSESVPVKGDAVESELNVYILLDFLPIRCSPALSEQLSAVFTFAEGVKCHRGACVTDGRHRLFTATVRAAAVRNAATSNQLQLATIVSPQPGTLCQSGTSVGILWKKHYALDILL